MITNWNRCQASGLQLAQLLPYANTVAQQLQPAGCVGSQDLISSHSRLLTAQRTRQVSADSCYVLASAVATRTVLPAYTPAVAGSDNVRMDCTSSGPCTPVIVCFSTPPYMGTSRHTTTQQHGLFVMLIIPAIARAVTAAACKLALLTRRSLLSSCRSDPVPVLPIAAAGAPAFPKPKPCSHQADSKLLQAAADVLGSTALCWCASTPCTAGTLAGTCCGMHPVLSPSPYLC